MFIQFYITQLSLPVRQAGLHPANGIMISIRVPLPGDVLINVLPFHFPVLEWIFFNPLLSVTTEGSNPFPSSLIFKCNLPFCHWASIQTLLADACFTILFIDSL